MSDEILLNTITGYECKINLFQLHTAIECCLLTNDYTSVIQNPRTKLTFCFNLKYPRRVGFLRKYLQRLEWDSCTLVTADSKLVVQKEIDWQVSDSFLVAAKSFGRLSVFQKINSLLCYLLFVHDAIWVIDLWELKLNLHKFRLCQEAYIFEKLDKRTREWHQIIKFLNIIDWLI